MLTRECPKCGSRIPVAAKFCHLCGMESSIPFWATPGDVFVRKRPSHFAVIGAASLVLALDGVIWGLFNAFLPEGGFMAIANIVMLIFAIAGGVVLKRDLTPLMPNLLAWLVAILAVLVVTGLVREITFEVAR